MDKLAACYSKVLCAKQWKMTILSLWCLFCTAWKYQKHVNKDLNNFQQYVTCLRHRQLGILMHLFCSKRFTAINVRCAALKPGHKSDQGRCKTSSWKVKRILVTSNYYKSLKDTFEFDSKSRERTGLGQRTSPGQHTTAWPKYYVFKYQ